MLLRWDVHKVTVIKLYKSNQIMAIIKQVCSPAICVLTATTLKIYLLSIRILLEFAEITTIDV
jgi:hypothetical protein